MPVNTFYQAATDHLSLGNAFYERVEPAAFPELRLRYRNNSAAKTVGLDDLDDDEWLAHFGRFDALPDNISAPVALKYHGHQFRHYNPDIGDGRGFLFAQLREGGDTAGRLLDLATKGSGQTPYSRDGDGRLTLKGGVREVLATELLEARGVYTSRSFSLIETGERLFRNDEPSPTRSAVLVRLGHSHVRFGTFQRLAVRRETQELQDLITYSIDRYWPNAASEPDPVAAFFRSVTQAVGQQAAEWFAAGFVHGVLNTDNTVITGESFDYGPWRFLPTFEPGFTAAYFDQTGLYAFARQPGALHWNLQRLADCLLPFSNEAALVDALQSFGPAFETRLSQMTRARLGLATPDEKTAGDDPLVQSFYGALGASKIGWEQTFHDLFGGAPLARVLNSPNASAFSEEPWSEAIDQIRCAELHPAAAAALASTAFNTPRPIDLLIDDVEAIWSGIAADDDWTAFERALTQCRAYGDALKPIRPPRMNPKLS
ncbi:MAG: YdiU family protein [Pseudomonadota bacterium]